jgi:diguanylate cyclase (GGDEF)-like protein/PAS domain S-box-containing protein
MMLSDAPSLTVDDLPLSDCLRLLTDYAPDMTVLLSHHRCRYVTSGSVPLLGHPAAAMAGTDLRRIALDADRHLLHDMLERLTAGASVANAVFRAHRMDGWVWIEANGRRLPAGAGAVLSLRDVTARKQAEAVLEEANGLLRRRATLDPLTGLTNRDHFAAALERELRRAQRDGTVVALLAIGLDGHRLFNDLYGWDAGNEVLRQVAGAAQRSLGRPADLAGRMHGDEVAEMLASAIVAGVAALGISHAGVASGKVGVTAGAAVSGPASDAAGLLQAADLAMRTAKGHPPAARLG